MSFYVVRPAEPQKRLLANATPATRRRFVIIARTTHPVAGSNSRSCPQCGSQFGVPDPPPVLHSPPRRPPASPAPPTATALPPTAGRKGYTSWPPRGPWGRRVLPGHDERETRPRSDAFRDALERRLPELFREAARARRMREDPDSPPIGVAATGCLRAALLLLLFFMLASLAMPLLLGAFIQLMSQ